MFGVRTATIARWTREGRLTPLFLTPGGHRRYRRPEVDHLLTEAKKNQEPTEEERDLAEDATRLYDQGWSIRQVAEKFDYGYSAMRRLLAKHTTLRNRGGRTY
jgi:predicted site-specific integrase-resolvase